MASANDRSDTARYLLRDEKVRFQRIRAEARGFGLKIKKIDEHRPWGGFVRFTHGSVDGFLEAYWRTFLIDYWRQHLREYLRRVRTAKPAVGIDAKLLLVAPGQRLSLQAHEGRSELWRVLEGPVVVVTGTTEEKVSDREVRPGEVVRIACRHLHRLAAPPSGWGVVAEIWEHEDFADPSDEDDITRYDDDYWLVSSQQTTRR